MKQRHRHLRQRNHRNRQLFKAVEVDEKGHTEEKVRIKEKGLLKGKIHIKRKGEQIVSNYFRL